MPKGYWIAHVEVRDPEGYKDYVAAARPAFENTAPSSWPAGGPMWRPKATAGRATS